VYGAELHIRSAPHVEIKSEADDRDFYQPDKASRTDAPGIVCVLDSGGLIRVMGSPPPSKLHFHTLNDPPVT
jgi:hypothetical protein